MHSGAAGESAFTVLYRTVWRSVQRCQAPSRAAASQHRPPGRAGGPEAARCMRRAAIECDSERSRPAGSCPRPPPPPPPPPLPVPPPPAGARAAQSQSSSCDCSPDVSSRELTLCPFSAAARPAAQAAACWSDGTRTSARRLSRSYLGELRWWGGPDAVVAPAGARGMRWAARVHCCLPPLLKLPAGPSAHHCRHAHAIRLRCLAVAR